MEPSELFPDPRAVELARAAGEGDLEGARRAIASGVSVDVRGLQYVTPLLWAIATSNLVALELLLGLGADVRAMDERGRAAVTIAVMQEKLEVLDRVLRAGGDPDEVTPRGHPLTFLAADRRAWDHLDALLDAGADVDGRDGTGATLVVRIALMGQYRQVAALLTRGADPRGAGPFGVPLATVVARGRGPDDSPEARELVRAALVLRGVDVPERARVDP